MPAPVSIAQIHVHSLRLASGAEALVARALTVDGVAGFGFSLGREAFPARDMAAWDAAGRSRGIPLYAIFGSKQHDRVALVLGEPGARRIDPFERGSLDEVRSLAQGNGASVLVAPHGHPWELSYCAALAATLAGDARIIVTADTKLESITVSSAPGIDIDWSLEPGFAALRWYPPR